jgi:uncharacterized protein
MTTQSRIALSATHAVLNEVIPARTPWSHVLRRGQTLRVIDTEGQQALDALFYSYPNTAERYSVQDTLREQGAAYIALGTRLISNEGRLMARITADSSGRHDTLAGCCACESNAVRFGMGKRDIVANVNLFMNVPIDTAGDFAVVDGISPPGSYVDLVAEMDLLCVFSNCPQINNPCNDFNPTPVQVLIWDTASD